MEGCDEDDLLLELELGGGATRTSACTGMDTSIPNGGGPNTMFQRHNGIPSDLSVMTPSETKSSYGTGTVYSGISTPENRVYANTSSSRQRKRRRGKAAASRSRNQYDGLSEYKQYLRGDVDGDGDGGNQTAAAAAYAYAYSGAMTADGIQVGYSHAVVEIADHWARLRLFARQHPTVARAANAVMLIFVLSFIRTFVLISTSSTTAAPPSLYSPDTNNNPLKMMRRLVNPQLQQVSHQIITPVQSHQINYNHNHNNNNFSDKDHKGEEQKEEQANDELSERRVDPPRKAENLPKEIQSEIKRNSSPQYDKDGSFEKHQQQQQQQQYVELVAPKKNSTAAAVYNTNKRKEKRSVVQASDYSRGKHSDYLPHHFRVSFANVWEQQEHTDLALFWHIPKSGGTTVADILTHCLNLVSASKIGATEQRGNEPILQVNSYADKGKYVNVDTSTLQGIERAKKLELAASGLADVVVTHRFQEGAELFDSSHKARTFCMFRHPVKRAISMFYYLQRATWEPTYDPSLKDMTLKDYAYSSKAESNWVTRFLTKEYTDKITEQHLDLAKEIMRTKIVVGILENFDESLKRFELYFGWWDAVIKRDPEKSIRCQQRKTAASHNTVHYDVPEKDDPGYQRLMELNWADMHVYEYAVDLFQEQKILIDSSSSLV